MPRWFVAVGLGVAASLGCAAQTQVTRVAPYTYQLECKSSLAICLVSVEEPCRAHGYDVLSATERRSYVELHPEGYESVHASAKVRCRQAVPMFGADPNVPVPPLASASAAAPSPPPPAASLTPPAVPVVAPPPSAPAAPSLPPPAAPPAPPAP